MSKKLLLVVILVVLSATALAAKPNTVKCPSVSSFVVPPETISKGKWAYTGSQLIAKEFKHAEISKGAIATFNCYYTSNAGTEMRAWMAKNCTPGNGFQISSQGAKCNKSSPAQCEAICVY